ncbi:phosphotransferase family protein [Actinospica durhamensis]|uniref:Phosphotransferase family protein n=1 Tax=Actinospica durhamensis TaxID=1508375 RepID=A0A941ESG2_9ACTN|nr:phosphotransferase family protein [Actinospica durhamensis]MBR7834279.1 phosphotransferase family protein [Actinospica durhamensis]
MSNPIDPPGLDLNRLRAHLEQAAPGLLAPNGELAAEVIPGGKSNLTYLVRDGAHRWVLRRPPLGHVLASAHDMAREFRVLTALAGTDVPVPKAMIACADPEVIGAPFYLMEFVDGTVLSPGELDPGRASAIACALVDVLARLHAVEPAAIGLADFGRPTGYLERQLQRWSRQLEASYSRPLPAAASLRAALGTDIPRTSKTCLLHGDYRLENVLIGQHDQVAAVLDWEMSALGDPLADLALFLVYCAAPEVITSAPSVGVPRRSWTLVLR